MESPIISTSEGKLQGCILKSRLGIYYWAFKGIPFAQPPIGSLRFKAPQEPLKWTGIRDASKHAGDVPIQNALFTGPNCRGIFGSEDCLYLNVYTNAIGYKRPVMFYIHGGGYVEGSGNDNYYSQDYLITKDIVLIEINYRLGPMGFLNLGHEVASGNQGIRDIIFALKWVRRNVQFFGGDPDNITIFGNSAGSITCHLLSLLPDINSLFKKAILQSGSVYLFNTLFKQSNFKNGFKIASLLGFNSEDPVKVIEFLRTVPAKDLVALEGKILSQYEKIVLYQFEYEPIIDADYTSDPVVPCSVSLLMKNNIDIPMIIGHTENESLLFLLGKFNEETYKYYDDNIVDIIKNRILLTDESKFPEIIKSIRDYYFKNQSIDKSTVWNLIDFLSDVQIINNNRKITDERNKYAKASTFLYNFNYIGDEPTFYNYDYGKQLIQGVAHADELSYLFYLYCKENEDPPKKGTKDRCMIERMLKMWYNFALTGNPTIELDDKYITTNWEPSSKKNPFYLEIGNELILKNDKDSKSRDVYEKYGSLLP